MSTLSQRINALKSIVTSERDFSVLMHRFMTLYEDQDDLRNASIPAVPSADLSATFSRVAESSLKRRVAITKSLWRAVPAHCFGFAVMRVNGHDTMAFYFADLGCGLIGISLGTEMRYSRFTFAIASALPPATTDPRRN